MTVDGANPRLMVPGSIRKPVEQAMRSKRIGSSPPWPLHPALPPASHPVALIAFWERCVVEVKQPVCS